ncbi:winged helix-turn-helix transcriptional regulator [Nocardia sp. NPDC004340]|uniref:winged helix-turn-helix transcriptional regulator n=1 Tax=Nocardia sp. CA-136227 TaxID=3239979 RepID=UPI003D988A1F
MPTGTPRPGIPVRGSTTGRPIMALFDLIGRRWVLRVLWELDQAPTPLTFRELRTACGDLSSSVLTRRLAELVEARLIEHADGYRLTSAGRALVERLAPLTQWADEWQTTMAESAPQAGR